MLLPGFPFRLRLGLAVLLVVGLVLASMLLVGGARSAGEASGLIAFARWDGIYAINVDGSGERALRRGGAAAGVVRLAWSPDGSRLAFSNKRSEVWAMDPDGSHPVRLVAGAEVAATIMGPLSWSPDGRRVAFTAFQRSASGTPSGWEIWIVNADGANAHPLEKTPRLWEFDVDWSPVGGRIAFTELYGGGMWSPLRLHVMSATGTILYTVNPNGRYEIAMPDWSPDGRRLAFMGWPHSRDGSGWRDAEEIWVTTLSGRWQRLTHNAVVDGNPVWSPDGRRIAFRRGGERLNVFGPEKRSPAEIYVMDADGTGLTRLTHNHVGEGSPAWQPVAAS